MICVVAALLFALPPAFHIPPGYHELPKNQRYFAFETLTIQDLGADGKLHEILQNIVGLYRMRESVRSKGAFYGAMADQVEPFAGAGGPAAAKTARFLSKALDVLFHEKLTRQQHALMECATAIVELETAVALVRAAGISNDATLQAQARVWASDVALSVPARLLKLFHSVGVVAPDADLPGVLAMQSGRLADLDFIAQAITDQ